MSSSSSTSSISYSATGATLIFEEESDFDSLIDELDRIIKKRQEDKRVDLLFRNVNFLADVLK